jgi:hypothetical protein
MCSFYSSFDGPGCLAFSFRKLISNYERWRSWQDSLDRGSAFALSLPAQDSTDIETAQKYAYASSGVQTPDPSVRVAVLSCQDLKKGKDLIIRGYRLL